MSIGAEIESMDQLGMRLGNAEQELRNLTTDVNVAMQNTVWQGNVHAQMQQAWGGEIQPALNRLGDLLQQAQREVKTFRDGLVQLDRRG